MSMAATITMVTMAIEPPADGGLFKLMAWLSPAFPVGAFSYSHGLEWAVEAGDIRDRASLEAWLGDVLVHGAGASDAIFLLAAHRAETSGDAARLAAAAELAAAFQPTKERALEALTQGGAFIRTAEAAWPSQESLLLSKAWSGPIAYPTAVGAVAAAHGIVEASTVRAYLHAFAANLISAAVRLVPLGQTDGQRALAALETTIDGVATKAAGLSLDDAGGAALRSDLASMRHETQYTRLFRS